MDIVERLLNWDRETVYRVGTLEKMLDEAAGEINRLRAILITISAVLENGREDKQNDKHPKGGKQVGGHD
jgi:hypothetical protein